MLSQRPSVSLLSFLHCRSILALALALGISLAQFYASLAAAQDRDQVTARVERVLDGDTFALEGVAPKIRIWGLDAPERDMIGGTAATKALRSLISGVLLRCDVRDIDRYRRIVGQCFLPDGRDVAAAMISSGTAQEYCRYSKGYYETC
jgi:micrococcal nuclease